MSDELRVSYGVKEMFEKVSAGISRIEGKLDTKADKHELDELSNTVRGMDRRVANLEQGDRDDQTLDDFKATLRRRLYAAATLVVAIAAVLVYLR